MSTASHKPRHLPLRRPKGWRKGRKTTSKMVTQRIKATRALTASIKVYRDQVAEGLRGRLAPGLREGEALPDQGMTGQVCFAPKIADP